MGVATMGVFSSSSIADGVVTEAKLAAEACSAAKMKKEGTAGHILTSNGAGAVPSYQAPAALTSDLVKIETVTLGAKNQNMESSAISAGAYYGFLVEFECEQEDGVGGFGIRLNQDTGNNYIGNHQSYINTTAACTDLASTHLQLLSTNCNDGDKMTGRIWITNIGAGYRLVDAWTSRHTTGSAEVGHLLGTWKSTTELAYIRLWATANTLAAASTMTIWGMRKP